MCSYRIIMTSVLFRLSSENMKKADAEDSDGQFLKKKKLLLHNVSRKQ